MLSIHIRKALLLVYVDQSSLTWVGLGELNGMLSPTHPQISHAGLQEIPLKGQSPWGIACCCQALPGLCLLFLIYISRGGRSRLQVQQTVLRALTSKAAGSGPGGLEFLLQKVLMVLASMHRRAASGRSPLQLSESASIIFDALRVVDACEVNPCSCHSFSLDPPLAHNPLPL